jgi:hypothetical protein
MEIYIFLVICAYIFLWYIWLLIFQDRKNVDKKIYNELSTSISLLFSVIIFLISWIYCIFEYGFLFGFGLGWLPSALLALISFAVLPIIVTIFSPVFLIFYPILFVLSMFEIVSELVA